MLHIFVNTVCNNFRVLFICVMIGGITIPIVTKYFNKSAEPGDPKYTYQKTSQREPTDSSLSLNDNHGQIDFNDEQSLFTKNDLSNYNGEKGSRGLYIAIMGSVYDVSKGEHHYGLDGSYHFFAGRDASTSFITGNFEKVTDDLDDVLALKPKEILSLHDWKKFYDKDYVYKGKLISRFYNENGDETEYYHKVNVAIQQALNEKLNEQIHRNEFPSCNIEWSKQTGTRVWCTTKSDGFERDWIGVPRKLFNVDDHSFRCACIKPDLLQSPNLKEYDGCDPVSTSCAYKE